MRVTGGAERSKKYEKLKILEISLKVSPLCQVATFQMKIRRFDPKMSNNEGYRVN